MYDTIAHELSISKSLPVFKVDATDEEFKDIAKEYNVKSYPTIMLFRFDL